jgi:hypothetical protein
MSAGSTMAILFTSTRASTRLNGRNSPSFPACPRFRSRREGVTSNSPLSPALRCPKCARRVAPFWLDADWARAMAWGAGEVAAYGVAVVLVLAGALLPAWALLCLLGLALGLVIPSVYWRVIARGRFYCSNCDTVWPRERLFPREVNAKDDVDAAIQMWIFLGCVLLGCAAVALYLNGWLVTAVTVGLIAALGCLCAQSGLVWWRRSRP